MGALLAMGDLTADGAADLVVSSSLSWVDGVQSTGEVYVFDPSVPRLVKTIPVGRGPAGLVLDRPRQVIYVVGFGDNNISVVDVAPGSETEYRVVQRIGFPRTTPR